MNGEASIVELVNRGFTDKGLRRDELDKVIDALATLDAKILHKALWVIGYSGDSNFRHVFEEYLERREHPELAALALKMLSDNLGLSSDYASYVHKALAGLEWDYADDIRAEALVAAGRILHEKTEDRDLASKIQLELTKPESSLKAHATRAAAAALGLTSREQARIPLDGSPELIRRFREKFLTAKA